MQEGSKIERCHIRVSHDLRVSFLFYLRQLYFLFIRVHLSGSCPLADYGKGYAKIVKWFFWNLLGLWTPVERTGSDFGFWYMPLVLHTLVSCFYAFSDQADFFAERDYVTFGCLLSQICLSSVTFVRPTHQWVETFGNISSSFCTLAILRYSSSGALTARGDSNIERCHVRVSHLLMSFLKVIVGVIAAAVGLCAPSLWNWNIRSNQIHFNLDGRPTWFLYRKGREVRKNDSNWTRTKYVQNHLTVSPLTFTIMTTFCQYPPQICNVGHTRHNKDQVPTSTKPEVSNAHAYQFTSV